MAGFLGKVTEFTYAFRRPGAVNRTLATFPKFFSYYFPTVGF